MGILAEKPTTKKPRKAARAPRCCFVCGGTESPAMSRQLGVVLDDRCRKQVEVLKNGGPLAERKELWERAIVHLRTATALKIMQNLGLKPAPLALKVEPCSTELAGEPCAVCMDQLCVGARIQTLECGSQHTFHHECTQRWLQESSTCPLCREDISSQCGHATQLMHSSCTDQPLAIPCATNSDVIPNPIVNNPIVNSINRCQAAVSPIVNPIMSAREPVASDPLSESIFHAMPNSESIVNSERIVNPIVSHSALGSCASFRDQTMMSSEPIVNSEDDLFELQLQELLDTDQADWDALL